MEWLFTTISSFSQSILASMIPLAIASIAQLSTSSCLIQKNLRVKKFYIENVGQIGVFVISVFILQGAYLHVLLLLEDLLNAESLRGNEVFELTHLQAELLALKRTSALPRSDRSSLSGNKEQDLNESGTTEEEKHSSSLETSYIKDKYRNQHTQKPKIIEMQVFNNFSIERKVENQNYSDDDSNQASTHSSTNQARKARSQENNMNRKYKLDNQKLTKEFSQDFLEDYKVGRDPYNKLQKKKLFKKAYESDIHQQSESCNNETRHLDRSDDDDEFMQTDKPRASSPSAASASPPSQTLKNISREKVKPGSMFGPKSYAEVCEEIKEKEQVQAP